MAGEFTVDTILTLLLLLKSKNGEHQIIQGLCFGILVAS